MTKYQVADIKFEFNYNFDNYFKNNIEDYIIEDSSLINHKIRVKLVNELALPYGNIFGKQNPYTITNEDKRIIFFKKKNQVSILMKHDHDYKNIEIFLNQNLIKNLPQTEYIMSGIMFLELAMHLGYLPIHATAISISNEAVLFSAPSGTGKSTHANYWKQLYPETIFINDDKPLINIENNELYVYGSPFSGEHRINKNIKTKLKAIVLLKQGIDNKIEVSNINEIIPELIKNTLNPKLESSWNKIIPLIEKIYDNIPVLKLHATNSKESVKEIYNYLKQYKIKF